MCCACNKPPLSYGLRGGGRDAIPPSYTYCGHFGSNLCHNAIAQTFRFPTRPTLDDQHRRGISGKQYLGEVRGPQSYRSSPRYSGEYAFPTVAKHIKELHSRTCMHTCSSWGEGGSITAYETQGMFKRETYFSHLHQSKG